MKRDCFPREIERERKGGRKEGRKEGRKVRGIGRLKVGEEGRWQSRKKNLEGKKERRKEGRKERRKEGKRREGERE